MEYVPVIGLEIHAELLTKSKIFCGCANLFGGEPNTRVCPICMGMPGSLPVINKEAVRLAILAGLCLNCRINNNFSFERKNYFYPDLPKAYQITQLENPVCCDGNVKTREGIIRINRIQIEEDAGKLIHDAENNFSVADYNRCGVPLIEIVTEPDFCSAEQVKEFVEDIILRLKYTNVCDARLEQGSIRVDVNISLKKANLTQLGTRAEIKNLNSMRAIKRAVEYEINRQTEILNSGKKVEKETRRFDENTGKTYSMRSKEDAHDYRFFYEPDLVEVEISDKQISEIKQTIPELPDKRMERYTVCYGILKEDAELLIKDKNFSDFYDETVKIYPDYKNTANIMLGTLNRCINETGKSFLELAFSPQQLAKLMMMQNDMKVSKNAAKDILAIMFKTGEEPEKIAKDNGFIMSDNLHELEKIIEKIISENQKAAEEYKKGGKKVLGYFMGLIIKSAGKGTNPAMAKEMLIKKLNDEEK